MDRPVVVLDTLIRFSESEDENDAKQNAQLVDNIIALRQLGARGVMPLHHAKKELEKEEMTLANVVRGSGVLAAMCDAVYGLKRDNHVFDNGNGPSRMLFACVKPRTLNRHYRWLCRPTTRTTKRRAAQLPD